MVDPAAKRMFSSRSLSRFSDIVSLCIQSEPEVRPSMSEFVECLELLNERSSADGFEWETFKMSFAYATSLVDLFQLPMLCAPQIALSLRKLFRILSQSRLKYVTVELIRDGE